MQVGIITFQKLYNYGACLQCYALWKYLSLQGHDVKIIDLLTRHHNGYIPSKNVIRKLIKKNAKYRLKKINHAFKDLYLHIRFRNELRKRQQCFENFWSLCEYTKQYRSYDDLRANPPEFDIYCTGSDQVWNPGVYYDWEAYFFPYIPKDKKKIAYAPSFGRNLIEASFVPFLSKWLSEYFSISVREESGKKIIKDSAGLEVQLVLDPTLLLTKEIWADVMVPVEVTNQYILCIWYGEGKSLKRLFNFSSKLQEKSGNHVVIITDAGTIINSETDFDIRQNIGPGEFLYLIQNARMVLSNSFHGAALSVILAQSFFVVLQNNSLDDRKKTLFSNLGLNENIIYDLSSIDLDYMAKCPAVNRHVLDEKLKGLREKSIQFLYNATNLK